MKTQQATSLKKQASNILDGIKKGEQAIRDNRVVSNAEAKKKMSNWLN